MEQKQLNFAEKPVQVLTLEELERSYHENLPTGDPGGGIYHFALIQQVLEIFEKRGEVVSPSTVQRYRIKQGLKAFHVIPKPMK